LNVSAAFCGFRALPQGRADVARGWRTVDGLHKPEHFFAMAEARGLPPEAEEISFRGFSRHVGPLYRLRGEGAYRFGFIVENKHMNAAGAVHGGMLMGLADVAMSRTTREVTGAATCSTVALSCDFLAPGKLSDLVEAQVQIARRTRTLVFLSATISAGDRRLLVAQGVWKIGQPR
jgi:uncharacterized protein (TIGR00369 family)